MKQFYFLCGLPRSGSTLLTSILSQNPAIYASPNSALVELLVNVRNHLRTTEQARAFMQPTQESDVLRGIMEGMYAFSDTPYVVDKSRAWPHTLNIELLSDILPERPKFIATVRDLPSVQTSFLKLVHDNKDSVSYIDKALFAQKRVPTDSERCDWLFSPGGTIYESWHSLKMAFDANYGELFHLVEYDDLVTRPDTVMAGMYDFLDIEPFEHDYGNIINETPEDDSIYQLPGMHAIRPVLLKTSPDPVKMLGQELFDACQAVPHFWRTEPYSVTPTTTHQAVKRNPFVLQPNREST